MRRPRLLLFIFIVLAGAAGWGLFLHEYRRNDLARENDRLREYVARLATEHRVADVTVTAQTREGRGTTTFTFQEYDRDGSALPPRPFTIRGRVAWFDALVLKFSDDYVGTADPLRGRSLHLFRRVFDDFTAPVDGFPIDASSADGIPEPLRGTGNAFERALWADFWKLASDPEAAAKAGVRVAQGEAVYLPLEMGRTYRLSIEADGGLNIRPAALPTRVAAE